MPSSLNPTERFLEGHIPVMIDRSAYPSARRKPLGTYKIIELVGTSPTSFAEAVKAAVAEASKTVRHMDWFEVVQERGRIQDGQVKEFQVTVKIGFKIEH
jgi:flavin-binding protein dodecin